MVPIKFKNLSMMSESFILTEVKDAAGLSAEQMETIAVRVLGHASMQLTLEFVFWKILRRQESCRVELEKGARVEDVKCLAET